LGKIGEKRGLFPGEDRGVGFLRMGIKFLYIGKKQVKTSKKRAKGNNFRKN
jgi:hypothetical protein